MDPTTIAGAISLAESIVNAIVANAPAIEADVSASIPYVQAIAGMIQGTNATIETIQTLLANANIAVDDFLKPLPPDDGTTTT
jgi:hypothetical protein